MNRIYNRKGNVVMVLMGTYRYVQLHIPFVFAEIIHSHLLPISIKNV